MSKATKHHQWFIVIHMIIQHIPCKQTLVCHVAVESNLYFRYATVVLYCINAVMTRVVCRPFRLMISFDCHGSSYNLFVVMIIQSLLSAFCDVCKYMFRMDWGNQHRNGCSNRVFKVYAFCHHCSIVHEIPHRLGSTMLCLSTSSLCNTSNHSLVHPHPMEVNIKSTIFQGDNDIHDNNKSSNSNIVNNDSNCLHHTSDSNESSSFLKGTSTHVDSKVFFNGLNGCKFYYNSSQDKIGFIPHNTDDIPVPPQFKIPSSCQLNMSPHQLELMLFINENFLSPSIFDKVMKWAHSATAEGYKFDSPSYSTLKKQNKWTTHSPILFNEWWWFTI